MKLSLRLSFIILLTISIITSSCGSKGGATFNSKPKEFAENMCKIVEEIGFDENFKLEEEYLEKNEKKLSDNFNNRSSDIISLLKEIDKYAIPLSQEQRVIFYKELLKEFIDTKCSDVFFENIPIQYFSKMIKEMESEFQHIKSESESPESNDESSESDESNDFEEDSDGYGENEEY